MKCSLDISNFLEEISSLSHFLLSSISLHWARRKAFLSLLAILWNSAFEWVYLSFSPLPFTSLLFSDICKASSDNHFAVLHFFSLGMVLVPVSCTMLWTSIHSFSGTLSIRSNSFNLSLPFYNGKGFDLVWPLLKITNECWCIHINQCPWLTLRSMLGIIWFCGFWQMHNVMYPQLQYPSE